MKLSGLAFLLLFVLSTQAGETNGPAPTNARLRWWREARFGMFIHYGPVTLTGREISWSRANTNPRCPNQGETPAAVYDQLYREFNPTNFNAATWAGTARAAGMKYVVLTAKHCDGFLLWNSKVDDYNISQTPFRRDLCLELASAVRSDGLKLGWYFSPMDWRDADFRTERNDIFLHHMQAELHELLTNYGRVDLLWFDYDGREAVYDQARTYGIVKSLQPQIIINNRLDLGVQQPNTALLNSNADYYTPEQSVGGYNDRQPWETCMTIGTQWAWKPNDQLKSLTECVHTLATCAGGDGNLLLNVGPRPDGTIEPRQVERLKEIGAWLHRNGESIYGTRGGPWKPGLYGAATRQGHAIYLHVFRWPGVTITLPAIAAGIKSARILGGAPVVFGQSRQGISVTVPLAQQDATDTVIKLRLDRPALDVPVVEVPIAH